MVFPFLSEIDSVNHSIDVIVADVGMKVLDERVHFGGSQGASRKQVLYSVAEDCMSRFPPRSKPQYLFLRITQFLSKEATSFLDDLAFRSPVESPKPREIVR